MHKCILWLWAVKKPAAKKVLIVRSCTTGKTPVFTWLSGFSCSIHFSYMNNSYNMYTTYTCDFFFMSSYTRACGGVGFWVYILVKHCLKNWEVSQLSGVSIRRQAGWPMRAAVLAYRRTADCSTAIHDDGEKMLTSIRDDNLCSYVLAK